MDKNAGILNSENPQYTVEGKRLRGGDAGLMCPRPMCPRPKILGCCAPGTKRPLDIVSLTDVSRPWTAFVKHGTSSVGRYRGLGRPTAPNGSVGRLAGFAYAPDQVYWIGAPPSDARSAHT